MKTETEMKITDEERQQIAAIYAPSGVEGCTCASCREFNVMDCGCVRFPFHRDGTIEYMAYTQTMYCIAGHEE